MCLNLKDYLFKINRYSYRSTYEPQVTTRKKNLQQISKTKKQGTQTYQYKIIKTQGKELKRKKEQEVLQKRTENK